MSEARKNVLIADSDERALIALERLLEDAGFNTTTAWNTDETVNLLDSGEYDLLLVADHPPELNCELVLRTAHERKPEVPTVVMENKPRHPFAEPYLMNLGAAKIVHKWQHSEVKDAVSGMLSPSGQMAAKGAVAGTPNLG